MSFWLPTGWAGVLALPSVLAAIAAVGVAFVLGASATELLVRVYAVVATGSLAQSRFGIEVFDIHEPIVELTAVHYIYAGAGALTLAAACTRDASSPRMWSRVAVVLTAVAPPIVAVGFVTSSMLPQVGGAVLMTLGVWCTAGLHLHNALVAHRTPRARLLFGLSGLAVWAPMVLAVAWAAGQHTDVRHLSIPDMARTHGSTMALAFVVCGLVAHGSSGHGAGITTTGVHMGLRIGELRFGQLSEEEGERLLSEARQADVTYDHVGSTLRPHEWPDRRVRTANRDIGQGVADFEQAVEALRQWKAHAALGADVIPWDQPIEPGASLLVVLHGGPFSVVAPNRIVEVVDEPHRFGFAYGTLPGHSEKGEESFVIQLQEDGAVHATIRVDARAGTPLAQIASPFLRRFQRAAIHRYLDGIAGPVRR